MIDIKQLHIGSHVLVDGKRERVEYMRGHMIGFCKQKSLMGYLPKELDPVPITEDLLKELGFSEEKDGVDNVKIYTKHGEEYHLQASLWDGESKWGIHVDDSDFRTIGNMNAEYLHELEAIVYLAIGVELLED